jgi:holin-like protein
MTKASFFRAFCYHIYTALAVLLCLLLGKFVYGKMGGLPGSIYGMIIFAVLLRLGLLSERYIEKCIDVYIKHMVIAFIPAVVGVMAYGDLLVSSGWKILTVAVITTVLGVVLAGLLCQRLLPDAGASSYSKNANQGQD